MTDIRLLFQQPLKVAPRQVPSDWIDYNGHMNVSYYSFAFDQAVDDILENQLGIGASYTKKSGQGPYVLQSNLHYLAEMLEGQDFTVQMHLIDHDQKRMHLFLEMLHADGALAATAEQMVMNVDLTTRRSTPYPDVVARLLSELQTGHSALDKPILIGAPLGIRRKG